MSQDLVCISPIDGVEIARRASLSDAALQTKIQKANEAQMAWQLTSIEERAGYCLKAVDAMLAMTDQIVPELSRSMGRPVRYGAGEMNGFKERALYMIDAAKEALAPHRPKPVEGFDRYIKRVPLGTVMTVAPWNYPYLTTVNSVVPALMAGNAVMLKPAQQTLLTGDRFQMAFDAAGLPEGLFQTLALTHDQTGELIGSGAVDMVCFTGSVNGGVAMENAAAGQFIPVGLELGGKDAAYVRADADIAMSVENLVDGAFFNSGQSCCGIERIYVHESQYDAFVRRFVEGTKAYVLGDPMDDATTLGPMINAHSAAFARKQVEDAIAAGAVAHVDAGHFPKDEVGSQYMAPQVLTNVDHSMSVMKDESFAPIVGIMPVASDDEAIALMNDSEFGLTASIWTQDQTAAEMLGDKLEVGTVFMNRCDYLDPALAWTGVKNTGRGCTLSALGYEQLTRLKSYHLKVSQ
ncbi:MAG: aldehyde dehydrogenase family protein [Kordiimonadaceae bacterium]|nr:aldehyde dehydrogenase family protein [Kordiimonadaceae bacterium]MBO6568692.1 aldehyde dehydrogenase family protein [Kordiimonadaceae bacterium]MBO6965332.1 aldehyde dehydrogenase family protein [Kordiimonadaceae bacterium]